MTVSQAPPEPLSPAVFSNGLQHAVTQIAATPAGASKLVYACLARIGELDPHIGAMVHLDVEGALLRAAELDEFVESGHDPLPLHGVPVVIKEIFSVEGMPDSSGSRLQTPELFTGEGSFIRRLRDAGCIILGKSLSTEFAFGQFNSTRDMPLNPAFAEAIHVTGGSSSGSAAAMAAGYCGLAIGTDTGGSVRGPAAMCGVVGFKPTAGIWLTDGIFPLSAELDTPGLFTGTVTDAAYAFSALGDDDVIIPEQRRLRIGVPERYFQDDLDVDVAAAFSDALEKIVAAGHELVPIYFPSMEPVERYFSLELPLELLETLGRERVAKNSATLDPLTRRRLMAVIDQTSDAGVVASLEMLRDEIEASMTRVGLHGWIAPTVPCVAPLQADLRDTDALVSWQALSSRNTRCINALGMCAISLPLSPELPAGLQLAAPGGSDASLLAHAILLETAVRGGH